MNKRQRKKRDRKASSEVFWRLLESMAQALSSCDHSFAGYDTYRKCTTCGIIERIVSDEQQD